MLLDYQQSKTIFSFNNRATIKGKFIRKLKQLERMIKYRDEELEEIPQKKEGSIL